MGWRWDWDWGWVGTIGWLWCNRLPTLCRDSRSSPERLQDGVNATLYIDRRSILLADHRSHFSYLLPHYILLPPPSSCIYRGSLATFTIKSLMQFHTLQSLHLGVWRIWIQRKARDDRNDKYQLRYIHIYALFFAILRKRPSFLYGYLREKGQLGMDRIDSRLSRTTRLATTATPWYQQTQPHPSIVVTKH